MNSNINSNNKKILPLREQRLREKRESGENLIEERPPIYISNIISLELNTKTNIVKRQRLYATNVSRKE